MERTDAFTEVNRHTHWRGRPFRYHRVLIATTPELHRNAIMTDDIPNDIASFILWSSFYGHNFNVIMSF